MIELGWDYSPNQPRHSLNDAQIKEVIKLAQARGLTNVHRISLGKEMPGTNAWIVVTSPERIDGRKMEYSSLQINYRKWMPVPFGRLPSPGGFWAEQRRPQTNRFTIFKIDGQTRYLRLAPEVTLDIADRILAWLVEERAKAQTDKQVHPKSLDTFRIMEDPFRSESMKPGNISAIKRLKAANEYEIVFGEFGGMILQLRLTDKGLDVISVMYYVV